MEKVLILSCFLWNNCIYWGGEVLLVVEALLVFVFKGRTSIDWSAIDRREAPFIVEPFDRCTRLIRLRLSSF